MRRVIEGKRIVRVEVMPDEIVLSGHPPEAVEAALVGNTVTGVGRHGKFWWLSLEGEGPTVFGHLGMSGWIRELDTEGRRLHSHGNAPIFDAEGRPRFLKLLIEVEGGGKVAFTDSRRFARLWLGESPESDKQVKRLGPDAHLGLPPTEELVKRLAKRKAPIKAVLLDQTAFAGIGNWIADEVLYQAGIAPKRLASSLSPVEVAALRDSIESVLSHAVEVDADYTKFPDEWLFHHRWGGGKGAELVQGKEIVRETVGGRTTAWVPERQK
jgi:formamidopyrimidine-DNA glycosylase